MLQISKFAVYLPKKAAATISLVSLLIGGTGVFVYFHYEEGDEMPNIANSSFRKFDWHKTEKTDLIGVDFNLASGGVIFEVGMIIAFILIIMMFCCCGIKHLPTPRCIKEKRKKNKEARRERSRKKKERLIVNPEFVEAFDSGDGSVQYDEDYDRQNEV